MMPEIETEEEPIDHDASESPEIDEKSLPGYKVDYSRVTTAVVRANSRLYQVDPRMLEKYKADHILIDGHLAFVDIDKKKVRPYLLAMLSQYEMLPELKLLNRIFFAVLVVGVFVLFAAFKPGDWKEIETAKSDILNYLSGSTIITTRPGLNPFGGSEKTEEKKVLKIETDERNP